MFLYGGARVIDGVITLGTFTAFMAYQMRLIGPVQGLMGLYTGIATARVSLRRVHELLDEPIEVVDAEAPAALGPCAASWSSRTCRAGMDAAARCWRGSG